MPRKRSKKQKVEPKIEPKVTAKYTAVMAQPKSVNRIEIKQEHLDVGQSILNQLDAIAYSTFEKFMKTRDKIIVVVYEVPASRLVEEDQLHDWRIGMETALVKQANNRRIKISRNKFIYEALPLGDKVLIKGYFRTADAEGGQGVDQHRPIIPPVGKEGLIIEE